MQVLIWVRLGTFKNCYFIILADDFNINLLSPSSTQSDYTNLLPDFSLI